MITESAFDKEEAKFQDTAQILAKGCVLESLTNTVHVLHFLRLNQAKNGS